MSRQRCAHDGVSLQRATTYRFHLGLALTFFVFDVALNFGLVLAFLLFDAALNFGFVLSFFFFDAALNLGLVLAFFLQRLLESSQALRRKGKVRTNKTRSIGVVSNASNGAGCKLRSLDH